MIKTTQNTRKAIAHTKSHYTQQQCRSILVPIIIITILTICLSHQHRPRYEPQHMLRLLLHQEVPTVVVIVAVAATTCQGHQSNSNTRQQMLNSQLHLEHLEHLLVVMVYRHMYQDKQQHHQGVVSPSMCHVKLVVVSQHTCQDEQAVATR